jgi:hypothetical protein
MSAGFSTGSNMTFDFSAVLAENRTCEPMMAGDYYMLAYGTGSNVRKVNAAYQFHVSEEGRGYVITFRPLDSQEKETTYYLKGLDPQAMYELEVTDTKDTMTLSGEDLMNKGLGIRYPESGTSFLIFYNQVG